MHISIPSGLPGFSGVHDFELERDEGTMWSRMRATENKHVVFTLASPWAFFPDFEFQLDVPTIKRLDLHTSREAEVLCIVTPGHPARANLLAPLVINQRTGVAAQIALATSPDMASVPIASAA